MHDLLHAWRGVGSSIVSLWHSRHLAGEVWHRVLVVFLFFAASSILQIIVPATVTVQSTNLTIPVTLRATHRPELTYDDFSSLGTGSGNPLVAGLGSLPSAMNNMNWPAGLPPGVDRG